MTTNDKYRFITLTRKFAIEFNQIVTTDSYPENGLDPSLLSTELNNEISEYALLLELKYIETIIFLICSNYTLFDYGFPISIDPATQSGEEVPNAPNSVGQISLLLGGNNIHKSDMVVNCFQNSSPLLSGRLLSLFNADPCGPFIYSRATVTNYALDKFVFHNAARPIFGPEFPVRLISTNQDWDRLVLNTQTTKSLEEILLWLQYRNEVTDDKVLSKTVKNGYRVLFHGPPGTGKSLTAALLGKKAGLDVYCIDLSLVVSKYIGETEKNLENVFKTLEHEDCILFFDEADALFGKRTSVNSAHDRYANQEVSYLLQRLEDFRGLTVLASNFKGNIDPAFNRRFNSITHFPVPGKEERIKIWALNEPENLKFNTSVDLKILADKYELTGSNIVNSIHYAFLRSLAQKRQAIEHEDLFEGVRKEYGKMEKSLPA